MTCRAIDPGGTAAVFPPGLLEVAALFSHFGVDVQQNTRDGETIKNGAVLLSLSGPAKKECLLVERTALNIIGRMSGIATQTRKLADLVKGKTPAAGWQGHARPARACVFSIKKPLRSGAAIPTGRG